MKESEPRRSDVVGRSSTPTALTDVRIQYSSLILSLDPHPGIKSRDGVHDAFFYLVFLRLFEEED